ncbi:hypothetical protein TSUD_219710 [Trifolium subterraneum]|uniref:Uncharacterized protein n=1 Tax=Trifolium subterraneum TaxID=3900 RepID=A0A2Z6N7K1_TRISU|nr:hypothetical protein TSUD_219710 [Trifolium subterraneum]
MDEGTANFQGQGSGDDRSDLEGAFQKDEVAAENAAEVVPVQHEQNNPQVDAEYSQPDGGEGKEQQFQPRRGGYQNQRGGRGGGGRRGYSNGRGGRGGGGGRGGRGGRGGGYYSNHGAGGQVNHVAGDVGVQS